MGIFKKLFNRYTHNDITKNKNIDIDYLDIFMDKLLKKNNIDQYIKYNYTYCDNYEVFNFKKNMTMKFEKILYNIRKNKRKYNFNKFDYRITSKIITIKMYYIIYGVKTYIKYKIFI